MTKGSNITYIEINRSLCACEKCLQIENIDKNKQMRVIVCTNMKKCMCWRGKKNMKKDQRRNEQKLNWFHSSFSIVCNEFVLCRTLFIGFIGHQPKNSSSALFLFSTSIQNICVHYDR